MILNYIGNTPTVKLQRIPQQENLDCEIYCKLEYFNAGGSIKDRIALRMIEEAENQNILHKGSTIIEPTSGNTGIGLALCAAVKGYRCILTMPEKMSQEKVSVLEALGAEIVRTRTEEPWDSKDSHIGVAKRLNKEIPNSVILDQYSNVNNPEAHKQTALEILKQVPDVGMICCGVGTGGTISGISKYVNNVKIIGVDPHGSILAQPESLNSEVSNYLVEGIGYDFVPEVLDRSLVDYWVKTNDFDSFQMARRLIKEEGLLCGGSSGAAMYAAIKAIKHFNFKGKVVVILPDSIRNYITKFITPFWRQNNGMEEPEILTLSSKLTDAVKLMKKSNLEFCGVGPGYKGIVCLEDIFQSIVHEIDATVEDFVRVVPCVHVGDKVSELAVILADKTIPGVCCLYQNRVYKHISRLESLNLLRNMEDVLK